MNIVASVPNPAVQRTLRADAAPAPLTSALCRYRIQRVGQGLGGVNLTSTLAGMVILAPVLGFRPVRGDRAMGLSLPRPRTIVFAAIQARFDDVAGSGEDGVDGGAAVAGLAGDFGVSSILVML